MLNVSRSLVSQFHKILRKSGFLKSSRINSIPVVRVIADENGLMMLASDSCLSISLSVPGGREPESIAFPVSCLAECSERTEGDVTFRNNDQQIFANWTDRNVPVQKEYPLIEADKLPPIPALPDQWSENPSQLIEALREAMRSADTGSSRYALQCVQLNGMNGQIAATDSHQLLVQRGFSFPWIESLLIPNSRVFESVILPQDLPVQVGKSQKQIHFRIGPWQIAFAIQTEGRFPDIERVIPDRTSVATRLQLDSNDAKFLVERLDQLPIEDEIHRPVTIDLNGSVEIRSRNSPDHPPTEIVLSRSQRIGKEIRIATDRRYLRRAIDLGFSEIGMTSDNQPIVCRDDHREFVWMVLEDATVSPSEQVQRVVSPTETRVNAVPQVAKPEAATPPGRRRRTKPRPARSTTASNTSSLRKTSMSQSPDTIPTEVDLINQLLELRTQLRTIETSIVTISRHLRARRKQQRLMKATLASLKQLQTLNV